MPRYRSLSTEQPHPDMPELDRMSPGEIAALLLEGERDAHHAVLQALSEIETACEWAAETLRGPGRIYYVGAGTSGRLGALDAAEMGPTFGVDDRVRAVIAGGPSALTRAAEGAEDEVADFESERDDLVIGISMSGTARFVRTALDAAPGKTILITANAGMPADLTIALDLGPEVLAGSTRLKGGSATKLVLNMISTAAMAGSGAVYGPWMVALRPTNRKLRARAERLVADLGGISREQAARLLVDAGDEVRVAVLMARRGLDPQSAKNRLESARQRYFKARDDLSAAAENLEELREEIEEEIEDLDFEIRPTKSNIDVKLLTLVWVPHWRPTPPEADR